MTRCLALLAAALASACGGDPLRRVTISVPYEILTLDPHARNNLANFALVSHFYDPLVTTDADMKIRPCLARLWENPDPSTWIFHLQKDARFHSGRMLHADDVVYSITRLQQERDLEIGGYVRYVAEVTAVDARTVRLRTTRPLSILLNKLRFVAIVPKGARGEDLAVRPDGTGAFRLAQWDRGRTLRMVRNDTAWSPSGDIEEVTFLLDRTPEQAAEDLRSGRAQLAQANSRAAAAALRREGRFEVHSHPSLFLKYIGYDVERAETPYVRPHPNPFRDLRVRRAFHLALDRRRLVDALTTAAQPASQLVPPTIFGFNPRLATPEPDPGEARRLLAEAGYAGGVEADLHVRKLYAEAAALVAEQLRPSGFRLQPKVENDGEFLDRLRRRDASLFLSRFGCPTGDASDILDNALHSIDPAHGLGMQNFGGYANPEVDRAIETSAGIESVADRRAALESIMARLIGDLVWVPLYVDEDTYAHDKRLRWRPRNDSFILAAEIGGQE